MEGASSGMASMAASSTTVSLTQTTATATHMAMGADSMTMPASAMSMTFFEATNTSLFSTSWTPANAGQYAGTCVFLVALAIAFRGLIAVRSNMSFFASRSMRQDIGEGLLHPYDGVDEGLKVGHRSHWSWTAKECLTRAVLDTVLGGVSYLL